MEYVTGEVDSRHWDIERVNLKHADRAIKTRQGEGEGSLEYYAALNISLSREKFKTCPVLSKSLLAEVLKWNICDMQGGRNRTGEEGVWGMGRPLTDLEPHTRSLHYYLHCGVSEPPNCGLSNQSQRLPPRYPKVQCGDPRHWVIASAQPPMLLHHHLEKGQDGRGLGSILGWGGGRS